SSDTMATVRSDLDVTKALLDRLIERLELDTYVLHRLDPRDSTLELACHAGVPADAVASLQRLPLGDQSGVGAVGGGQRAAEVVVAALRPLGLRAHVSHPLLAAGRFLGTLAVGTRRRPHFDLDELEFLKAVTDHAALALDRERLLGSLDVHERLQVE